VRITVIGVGHVGLVSAAAFAHWGHEVVGLDHDPRKVASLRTGEPWFHEPGLTALLTETMATGRLRFTEDEAEAYAGAEAAFICVGTPPLEDGSPDLRFVEAAGRAAVAHADRDLVLVEKSTVPAATGARLEQTIAAERRRLGVEHRIEVASNPEFLREGVAVADTLHPDRLVYGTSTTAAREVLRELYKPLIAAHDVPVVETDVPTAELIKHASNAFLATRISFINAVARICDRVGADVTVVADGMGHDRRIGRSFLDAGLGYGGSCFPKDIDAFAHLAASVGEEFELLDAVRAINVGQRDIVVGRLTQELWHLQGKTVALLGGSFKPGTDDLRESPALHLADLLLARGAAVRVYDPGATAALARERPDLQATDDLTRAMHGAHAAVVCTDWPQIAALTPDDYLRFLTYPVVVDGRNVHDPAAMLTAGLRYHAIGRRSASLADQAARS
jgi:UDPglucose 6-dehydrogenase